MRRKPRGRHARRRGEHDARRQTGQRLAELHGPVARRRRDVDAAHARAEHEAADAENARGAQAVRLQHPGERQEREQVDEVRPVEHRRHVGVRPAVRLLEGVRERTEDARVEAVGVAHDAEDGEVVPAASVHDRLDAVPARRHRPVRLLIPRTRQ